MDPIQPVPKLLTAEELRAATQREVPLSAALAAMLGGPRTLTVRRISSREYLGCLAPLPPGFSAWPTEERITRAAAWFDTLPAAEQAARLEASRLSYARIVALASVAPRLTVEEAERLGDDLDAVLAAVLELSGLAGGGEADAP